MRESEEHQSWSTPVEDFWNHVATDGSLLGVSGRWSACGWSLVQLDYDDDTGRMRGMYGTVDADLEVQRTTKRAELTAVLLPLQKDCWSHHGSCGQQGNY